ncbi:ErfK/YbiS/YcfS/YnhG family protein [Ancylobacter novellus DSM 506]|uniref:ErfK/YbiS/YcfS/YnhG family protein n=1 Tax=Ancylobacter novellus (strain ATCC 8093 / DSM 506 / JCM 20403 / CCM 1077 / IAM 12100 / NBRC 12443 / NCIMB 10456) TaxID=639283 RepID=D6ZZM2_ANCN5|nr:L,D-transpeptidase [Ancylobacter novellus]ADH91217.1 ErfK/YbiS/YcfS/YnhG family protein [Ancylobacter novellus DSM 506]
MLLDRRLFLLAAPVALAGCASNPNAGGMRVLPASMDPQYLSMYGAITDEPFPVPAVDLSKVDPRFLRQEVAYQTRYPAGTIVVDPNERHAYLVLGNGRALRYGVGVGKEEGFNFRGEGIIARKASWPRWTPTPNMIAREPERYGPYANGMAGGLDNPLGPRALYIYKDGQDTLYRLHGTTEPWTIGTMVSSGCVRFMNQDIIDLFRRAPTGTRVVVLPARGTPVS